MERDIVSYNTSVRKFIRPIGELLHDEKEEDTTECEKRKRYLETQNKLGRSVHVSLRRSISDGPITWSTSTESDKKSLLFPTGAMTENEIDNASGDNFSSWYTIHIAPKFTKQRDDSEPPQIGYDVESFVRLQRDPFALHIVSEPVRQEIIDEQMEKDDVRTQISAPAEQKNLSKSHEIEKARNRYAELQDESRFTTSIYIGAASMEDAQKTAITFLTGVHDRLCTYTLEPYNPEKNEKQDDDIGISVTTLNKLLPASLKHEIPGIVVESRPNFALNVPPVENDKKIHVGTIINLYGDPVGDLDISSDSMTHVGVYGTTGSGKTSLIKQLTSETARPKDAEGTRTSVIIVDPKGHDTSSRGYAGDLANMLSDTDVTVTEIKPGAKDALAISDNIFDPGSNDLERHIDELITILTNAFGNKPGQDDPEAAEVTKRYLNTALRGRSLQKFDGIYQRFGWNIATGKPLIPGTKPDYPTIVDLPAVIKGAVDLQGYSGDAKDVGPFLVQRFESLTGLDGGNGRFFSGEQINWDTVFGEGNTTVFDLSALPDEEKSIVMGMITLRYKDFMQHGDTPHNAMLVLDEANRMIKDNNPTSESMCALLSQVREFGGKIILAGQTPSQLPDEVISNSTTIAMKLPNPTDIEKIAGSLGLDEEQQKAVSYIDKAEVIYRGSRMQEPVRGKVQNISQSTQGNARVYTAENLAADPETILLSEERRADLLNELQTSIQGNHLTALVEITLAAELLNLGRIALDEDELRKNNVTSFTYLKSLPDSERKFLVKEAVRRSVHTRSRYLCRNYVEIDELKRRLNTGVNEMIIDPKRDLASFPTQPNANVAALLDAFAKDDDFTPALEKTTAMDTIFGAINPYTNNYFMESVTKNDENLQVFLTYIRAHDGVLGTLFQMYVKSLAKEEEDE